MIWKRTKIEPDNLGSHINHHELRAILRAIQAAPKHCNIIIYSDSQVAQSSIHKGRSSVPEINAIVT